MSQLFTADDRALAAWAANNDGEDDDVDAYPAHEHMARLMAGDSPHGVRYPEMCLPPRLLAEIKRRVTWVDVEGYKWGWDVMHGRRVDCDVTGCDVTGCDVTGCDVRAACEDTRFGVCVASRADGLGYHSLKVWTGDAIAGSLVDVFVS